MYSYGSFDESDYLEDMTKAVCMLVHEGLNYRFSHRSFQEYFAAVYTTQLSDEEQRQFISSWLKGSADRMTTDFLNILCELQPDRFMKNILYNALCELYNLYKENGCSEDWFIEYIYSGICVDFFANRRERIAVIVKEPYYHTIFMCMLKYLHFKFEDGTDDEEYRDTIAELKKKYGVQAEARITFNRLRRDGLYDRVKKAINWMTQRMNYVFNELDKIDINTFGGKRKFESMLDEL